MAHIRLKRLSLQPEIISNLQSHKILTCRDVLSQDKVYLLQCTAQSNYSNVNNLIQTASKACSPKPITALEVFKRNKVGCLPTSLLPLDKLLLGGLLPGTVTEVTGPPGIGKTQFCMMLSVQATLPPDLGGLGGTVAYIDTESTFTARRLVEIGTNRYRDHFLNDESIIRLTESVYVYREPTCQSLSQRLDRLEEEVISKDIRLVVVDSVASPARKEYDNRLAGNLAQRTALLCHQAALLKSLAQAFNIPVVVTNQVTTGEFEEDTGEDQARLLADQQVDELNIGASIGHLTAALGNTWSHSVNTRLILQYLEGNKRQIVIAKSPMSPPAVLDYTIEKWGLSTSADAAEGVRLSHGPSRRPITALDYHHLSAGH